MSELTPSRVPQLNDAPSLRCRVCGFTSKQLHPVLRLTCPTCFARWVALSGVPQLDEVLAAPPVASPVDPALVPREHDRRYAPTQIHNHIKDQP